VVRDGPNYAMVHLGIKATEGDSLRRGRFRR
jgi:hypothetical protein